MAYALANRLLKAVKASGLPYEEVPRWKSRGRGTMGTVATIVCHHTATPRSYKKTTDYPTMGVVRNGRPGLNGPLAQLGLGRSGKVYLIAAGIANHAGKTLQTSQGNSHAIGIEAEGAMEAWPKAQYEAYARLCAALAIDFGLPTSRVLGHKEVAYPKGRKADPSFNMAVFRKLVDKHRDKPAAKTTSKSAPKPTRKPAPKAKSVPGPRTPFPLPKGAYFGPNSPYSGFYNRRVGATTDRHYIKAFAHQLARRSWSVGKGKTWLKSAGNDGMYGSEYTALVKAFQKDQRLAVDGLIGKKTWDAAFQNPIT